MRTIHKALLVGAVAATCGCTDLSHPSGARAAADSAASAGASGDWPTFGGSNARTNANSAATKITAANVASMVRQQVKISAPIDAGLIYLRGAQVNGASHDVFLGTTHLGRTVAIDAKEGAVLWEYAPPGFDEAAAAAGAPAGTRGLIVKQITNSTPVADDDRRFIYAGSADGKVTKISIADGKAGFSRARPSFFSEGQTCRLPRPATDWCFPPGLVQRAGVGLASADTGPASGADGTGECRACAIAPQTRTGGPAGWQT